MRELDRRGRWIGHRLARFLSCFSLLFLGWQVSGEPAIPLPDEETVEVPNVVGRGIDGAELILAEHGLKLGEIVHKESEVERGTVIAQEPVGGMFVPPGTAVHLVVSLGLGDTVEVPSVLEFGIDDARHVLAEAGLEVGEVTHRESEAPAGMVIAQEPAAGAAVPVGTAVHLVVSSGVEDKVEVPNVLELHIDEARDVLAGAGLTVGEVSHRASELEPGTVLVQDPRAGNLVSVGTAVYLVVSSGIEQKVEVPNVVGRGIDMAEHILREHGLNLGELVHKESEAEPGTVIAQEPAGGMFVPPGTAVHLVVSSGIADTVEVPSVVELGIDDARHVLAEAGLKVGEVVHRESEAPPGTVIAQEPAAGEVVPVGTVVHLVVSSGIADTVEVPHVVELHIDQARDVLAEVGLEVSKVTYCACELEPGIVLAQDPRAGTAVPVGTGVYLVVSSRTEEKVEVPNVVGRGIDQAEHILAEFGLKVGEIAYEESESERGTVIAQEPAAGTAVAAGSSVHLVVSLGVGDKVEVPRVLELPIDDARHIIAEAGLKVGEVSHKESEAAPGTVLVQEPAPGTLVPVGAAVHLVVSSGTERKVEVPSVVGRGIDMAERILQEHGLRLGEVSHTESEAEPGTVIAQEPAAGAAVPAGTAVHLVVSAGMEDKVEVPNLVGRGLDEAGGVLAENGLTVGALVDEASELEPGTVIAQEPPAGTNVLVGTAIHLIVSSGSEDEQKAPQGPIATIGMVGNAVSLSWETFGTGEYIVQWTDDLASGVWRSVPRRNPTDTSWTDSDVVGIRKRYYRVVSQ